MNERMARLHDLDLEKEIAEVCEALDIDRSEVDAETVAKVLGAQIFMDEIAGEGGA